MYIYREKNSHLKKKKNNKQERGGAKKKKINEEKTSLYIYGFTSNTSYTVTVPLNSLFHNVFNRYCSVTILFSRVTLDSHSPLGLLYQENSLRTLIAGPDKDRRKRVFYVFSPQGQAIAFGDAEPDDAEPAFEDEFPPPDDPDDFPF